MHVKKNDLVEVIAGEDAVKGRAHRVLRVLPTVNKVVVEGVNRVYKHVKPNKRNPQGGRLSVEAPMAASNVMLFFVQIAKKVSALERNLWMEENTGNARSARLI